MILIALAIKWETPGPVLDRRASVGYGGRAFQMLRFRTTVHDHKGTTPAWAKKSTYVGQLLRYSRIEALPQLINVLRGEMSIVDRERCSPSFLD